MDKCSYFIENKAIFGSFPSQDEINTLEQLGVRVFVDVTIPTEYKVVPYTTNYTVISYPIQDNSIPKDCVEFCSFIYNIYIKLKNLGPDEKLYLHCKGGHGRSGVVVAMLLALYHNIPADAALNMTWKYHQNRKVMKDKWRKIGSPQTPEQINFVRKMFEPIDMDENEWMSQVETTDFVHKLVNTYFRKITSIKSPEIANLLMSMRNEYLL
jgi:protein-tyrosine phosphatase